MSVEMDDVLAEMEKTDVKTPKAVAPVAASSVKEKVVVKETTEITVAPTEPKAVAPVAKVTKEDNTTKIVPTLNSVVFDSEKYKNFIEILNNVSSVSTDVHIKDSMIRQKIMSKTMLYSIDLTKLVDSDKFNSIMVVLKEKVNLLKVFGADGSSVSFFQDDSGKLSQQVIHDDTTMFKITNPSEKIIDQIHQDPNIYKKIEDSMTGNILFSISLNKHIAKIKAFIESFGAAYIDIKGANGTIEFKVQSSTKDMVANLMSVSGIDPKIMFDSQLDPNALISFNFDKSFDIEFAASLNLTDPVPNVVYRITNDFFGIVPVKIYQKTKLK